MLRIQFHLDKRGLQRLLRVIIYQAKGDLGWCGGMHDEIRKEICLLRDLNDQVLVEVPDNHLEWIRGLS